MLISLILDHPVEQRKALEARTSVDVDKPEQGLSEGLIFEPQKDGPKHTPRPRNLAQVHNTWEFVSSEPQSKNSLCASLHRFSSLLVNAVSTPSFETLDTRSRDYVGNLSTQDPKVCKREAGRWSAIADRA